MDRAAAFYQHHMLFRYLAGHVPAQILIRYEKDVLVWQVPYNLYRIGRCDAHIGPGLDFGCGIDVTDPKNFDNIIDKITTKDVKKFTQKLFKGADVVDMIFQPKSK